MTPGTPQAIQEAVRERYSQVARQPSARYTFRVGRAFAEALGYPADLLDELPPTISESFTGVAAPSIVAEVGPGDTVVDLGSGGGLDLLVLARKVGAHGRVIGIDFAPAMVERASRNLTLLGLLQAEVWEASAEETGLPAGCADWVVVNGLLNLTPDKSPVLREIARILPASGRLLLAETTLRTTLPADRVQTVDDWFR